MMMRYLKEPTRTSPTWPGRSMWAMLCLSLLLFAATAQAQVPTLPASPTACDYTSAPANISLTAQNVPAGYSTVYLLVNMTSGLIVQANATNPVFNGVSQGMYYAVAAHYKGVLTNAMAGKLISDVYSSDQCLTYGTALALKVCPAIATCDYATAPASVTFTANSVPGGVTTSYALVNMATNLIAQVSSTPSFAGVPLGEYAITSVHYTGSLTALVAGNRLYDVTTQDANCLSVSNTLYIKVCNSPIAITGPPNGSTVASLNPPISGTSAPGASVTVTAGPGSSGGPCITTANASGVWSCSSITFPSGPNSVTATDGTTSAVSNFTVTAQEICGNGIDDDGDGLIDFNDPDCNQSSFCNTSTNLIVNGDFQAGNTGFTSDYPYQPVCGPVSPNLREYVININPTNCFAPFLNTGDHTTGTGKMMMINGSNVPNENFWKQTVTVNPTKRYAFSIYAINIDRPGTGGGLPQFRLTANGVPLTATTSLAENGTWTEFRGIWDANGVTSVTLAMQTLSTAFGGNDLAVDDMQFFEVATGSRPVANAASLTVTDATGFGVGNFTLANATATVEASNTIAVTTTYYATQAQAEAGTPALSSPYSATTGTIVFARVEGNGSGGCYTTAPVTLLVRPTVAILSPATGSTATTTPTISGTATSLASVTVLGPNSQSCVTTASASGTYACASLTFASGPASVTAIASNAGGTSSPAIVNFTAVGPASLTVAPTGPQTTTAPVISGTATPGSTVVITGPGPVTLCTTTASASGTFSCPVTVPAGPNTLTVTACTSGGCSTTTTSFTAVAPPTVAILSPANNGTATTTPTISGTATPLASVTVLGPNSQSCVTTASASGTYACASLTFAEGPNSATAIASNAGGTSSPEVNNFTVVAPPTVAIVSPTGGSTITTTPTISGTATPNSTVTVYFPNVNPLLPPVQFCQTTASATGAWSCSGITVLTGPQTVTAIANNANGISTPATTNVVIAAGANICAVTLPLLLPLGSALSVPNYCPTPTWIYYKDLPASTSAYMAIDPNGNAWNPVNLSIDATTVANHTATSGSNTTQLANRMFHILAPGSFTANGGIKVRLYYNPAEFTSLPTGRRTWFKHPAHLKTAVLADLTSATLTNAVSVTPDASGTELGVGAIQVAYVEFHNVTGFSTFGYMGSSSGTPPSLTINSPAPNAIVSTSAVPVSGTATPGSQVVLTDATNATLCTTTATAGGSYSCAVNLAPGSNTITAVASNTDGTSSPATIQVTAVSPASLTVAPTGPQTTTAPVISGTATPGSLVVITGPGPVTLCTTTASASGTFSCPVSVSAGPNTLTVTACTSGGCSTTTTSFTAVAPPTVAILSPANNTTQPAATNSVSGTATPGATVVLATAGGNFTTTADPTTGAYSVTGLTFPSGPNTVTATATNVGGTATTASTFTIAGPTSLTVAPPVVGPLTQPISGTATPGSLIVITGPGPVTLCTTTASASGTFSCPVTLTAGVTTVTVTASGPSGTTAVPTTLTALAPPTVAILSPADDGTATTTPTISGTATPLASVTVLGPNSQSCITTASASGTYACSSLTFASGPNSVTAVASNVGGVSTPAVANFTAVGGCVATSTSISTGTVCGTLIPVVAGGAGSLTYTWGGPTMAVTVANKDATHPYFGTGSSMGFVVDGKQGRELTLVRGVTYNFAVTSPGHPLVFTSSPIGGAANTGQVITAGVTNSGATSGTMTFTPSAATPNLIYYNCNVHANMGWKVNIIDPQANGVLVNAMAGLYSLTVTGTGSCSSTATATAIACPPTVAIDGPANGSTVASLNPPITGTATPGSTVTITGGPGSTGGPCIVTASGSGTYACTSLTFTSGPTSVTAQTSDNGVPSSPVVSNFTTTGPASLTVAPTGPMTSTAPVISGTATPGSTVVITGPGPVTLCTTTASASGTFSCPVTVPVGPNTLTVTACTGAGCATATTSFTALAPPTVAILSPADNGTATTTPTISGTATPLASVTVLGPNSQSCVTTASASGTYACSSLIFTAGPNSVTAIASNGGGVSPPAVSNFTAVSPTGPPSLTVAPTGPTTSTAPVISGTATPGSEVVITGPGPVTLCTTTASASGTFSCPVTVPVGPQTLTVTACTGAGCATATTSFTAVEPPTVAILSPANNGTATTTPTISGTATPLASVTVLGPNGQVCSTTASAAGSYSCSSLTFTNGPASVTAIASNGGGTSSPAIANFTAVGPTGPPSLTVAPTGPTTSTAPVISGTATPGSEVVITGPGPVTLCTTTASASGTFSCPVTVTAGPQTLTVTACTGAGCATATASFTALAPPTVAILSPANNTTQPAATNLVSGTATPGATVVLATAGGNFTTTADPTTGTYSVTGLTFPSGPNTVTATATNVGGTATTTSTFTIAGPTSLTVAPPVVGPLTQPISGTATPGSVIVITGPGPVTLCTTTASASGTFSCPVTLTAGVTNVTVTASGPGGTTAVPTTLTALAPPTVAILSPATNGTATTTPTVSGTATPLASVTVLGPNSQSCVTTASASGTYACSSLTFASGPNSVTAVASNVGGVSTPAVATFTAVGPASLTVAPTGPTTSTAPVISGTATPGSEVVITGPGPVTLCTTTASASGTFSCPVTVTAGPQTLTVTACTGAGCATATTSFTAVEPPTVAILSPATNTTQSVGTNIVSGTATPFSTVILTTLSGGSATITMGSSTTYSVTFPAFPTGLNTVTATATNVGGTATTTSTFTISGPTSLTVAPPVVGPLTQPVAGTATPGSLIVITGPGPVTLCTTTASASGTFSCPVTLTAGVTTVTVTASGPGGTTAVPTTLTAVAPPTVAILSPASNGTATTTPTVSGTATPLASVTVLGPNGQVCSTTASAAGSYSCSSLTFTNGPASVTAIAGNNGVTSPPAIVNFTAVGPASLTVAPTGPSTTTAPVISGTATPGSTVVITGPGPVTLCTTTASASGTFSCPVTVTAGPQTLTVTACTGAGCATAMTSFTALAPPTVAILSPADNGTATTTPTVSGTATPLASVTVLGPNSQSCVTTASASGTYACSSLTFAAGPQSVTAVVSNPGGTATDVNTFTAVGPTGSPSLTVAPTGPTTSTAPVISGTATPGSEVVITGPGPVTLCTTTASASGTFSCPVTVTAGPQTLTVTACTGAGCATATTSFTAVEPPTVAILSPATNTTQSVGTNIVSGTATPFSTVILTTLSGGSATITMGSSTTYSVTFPAFPSGPNTVTATATNVGGTATTTSTFTVTTTNQAPSVTPDFVNVVPGIPATGNVLTNDKDPEGTPLTASVIGTPPTGLTMSPNGSYTYTAPASQTAPITVPIQVCDSGTPPACSTTTLTLVPVPPTSATNDAPIANPDAPKTTDGVPVVVAVLANDVDPEGQPLSNPVIVTQPTHGTAVVNPNGTVSYTPTAGYTGTDVLTYSVCDGGTPPKCSTALVTFTIDPALPPSVTNTAPVAIDDALLTQKGVSGTGTVAANDSDPQGQPLVFTKLTNPTNGTVVFSPTGSYTFTPSPTFVGSDVFTYQVCDNASPVLCTTATVYLTVPASPNSAPSVTPDFVNVVPGIPATGNVLTNDKDPEGTPLTASVIGTPPTGLTMSPNGSYTYTAPASQTAPITVPIQVCDSGTPPMCTTTTLTLVPVPPTSATNDAPIANPDTPKTTDGVPVVVAVLANDVDPEGQPLSNPVIVSGPTHGTAVVNPNGTVSYTPTAGYTGTDQLTYSVCDGGTPPKCSTALVTFTIDPTPPVGVTNTAPVALDDALLTQKGVSGTGTVATNDSDPQGQPLVFAKLTNPVNGTVVFSPTGSYTFTPSPTFVGSDVFTYQVCDNASPALCTTATVHLTVPSATNAAPSVTPDFVNAVPGIPATGNVLTNDKDPEGTPLTASVIGTPPTGLTMSPDGSYTYTAPASQTAPITVPVQVCDSGTPPMCTTTTLTLVPVPPTSAANDAPIANPDTPKTTAGVATTVNVLANDVDPEGQPLSNPVIVSGPVNGTAVVNPNGTVSYTPTAGYTGTDVLTYSVCDGGTPPKCSTALVTFTIDPAPPVGVTNTAPVAIDDALLTQKGVSGTGTVAANDSDPQGQPLVFTKLTNPASGTVVFSPTGSYTFTPSPTFVGSDVFTYQVCDNASPVLCTTATVYLTVPASPNSAPSVTPDFVNAVPGIPATGNVLTNDKDPEGTPLTASVIGTPPTGLTMSPNGSYTYTAPASQTAPITVPIQVCDSGTPPACATTTLTLVPVPPTSATNDAPIANPDAPKTTDGVPVVVAVLANDVDPEGQPLSNPTIVSQPTHGTAVVNPNGTVSYTPTAGYTGTDVLTYSVCDGGTPPMCSTALVTFTIDPTPPVGVTNTAPVAIDDALLTQKGVSGTGTVATNDSDPQGQPLTFAKLTNPVNGTVVFSPTGSYTWTPSATFVGSDVFTYQVCDNASPALCTTATVHLTVPASVNGVPSVTPDIANTNPNTPVSGNVLTNDSDPQGLPLTASLLTPPVAGTVVISPNGSYTYTPPTNFTGVVSFCYSVSNTVGQSGSACVTVNVNPIPSLLGNNPPIANNDNTQTTMGIPVGIVVLANDTDPDDATSVNGQLNNPTILSQPSVGTAVVNGNGTMTYTPPATFTGVVSFPYQVCDKATSPLCTTALVTVNVQPTPPVGTTLAPVAIDDALLVKVNTPKSGTVGANDSDPAGLPLTFSSGQPSSGTVAMSPTGSYTYTPTPGFTGPASFTYSVCNSAGNCDVATVSIDVQRSPSQLVSVPVRVFLQGALIDRTGLVSAPLMRDDLRRKGLIPIIEPYTSFSYVHVGGGSGLSIANPSAVFSVTGANAIIDWVMVELRSATAPYAIVATTPGLVQADGDVVQTDGVSVVAFDQSALGGTSYQVSVHHRNHLGVMTANPISLTGTVAVVDFTNAATPIYRLPSGDLRTQTAPLALERGLLALWAGNTNGDQTVILQGPNNDVDAIFYDVIDDPLNTSGLTNFIRSNVYLKSDVDLDGQVIFQGQDNEVDILFFEIILHPDNAVGQFINFIIWEQLP